MVCETEPSVVYAGDSLEWSRSWADYPASAWSLKYWLVNSTGRIEITAAAQADDSFLVSETAATTGGYTVGLYRWQAKLTRTSDSFVKTIAEGRLEIKTGYSLGSGTGAETRSQTRQMVDALRALILGKASVDQKRYKLDDGRELERLDLREVTDLLKYYEEKLRTEEAAEDALLGRKRVRRRGRFVLP